MVFHTDESNLEKLANRLQAAVRCNNPPAAAWKIAKPLDAPDRLASMRDAARLLARPNAAADIAQDALRLLD